MKKICIIAAAYPPNIKGGGEKSTQLLARGLADLGNDVFVLTIDNSESEFMDENVSIKTILTPNIYWNFKHTETSFKKLIWHFKENYNPRAKTLLMEYLQNLNPDVVITSTIENFGNAAWDACHELNIPVAHILRSYYVLCFKGTMFNQEKNCSERCTQCRLTSFGKVKSASKVNGLIGISDFILQKHISYFTNALPTVIFNPVQTNPLEISRESDGNYVFAYLGRIEPEKGVELLLQAFETLPENYQLKIAGSGKDEYVNHLKQKYPNKNIDFLGWVAAEDVYKSVNFVVVPSMWNEPFGRTVIEAYSYGVPVIASSRGGLKELIIEGETGQLFDPSHSENFKQACLDAVANNLTSQSTSSLVQAFCNKFSTPLISSQYDAFLDKLINSVNE